MYCRKCGTWCEDSAVFCTQCGEVLGEKTTGNTTQGTYNEVAGETHINYGNAYQNNVYGGGYSMGTTYAGFWKRAGAIIIDGVIVGIVNSIIGAIVGDTLGSIIALITAWIYYAYMESSEYQATLGKMVFHLRVIDLNGNRISFTRATARYFSKIISGFILCIGYMMAGWTQKKQALHDIIASTLVVNE